MLYQQIIGMLTILIIATNTTFAWTIGEKDRAIGPVIHTTYFLTPYNQELEVHAKAYVGFFVNNHCQYRDIYDIGTEKLKTGDLVNINAISLRDQMGGNYSCMIIYYTAHQLVTETIELFWDGINYYTSNPTMSEVNIL